MNSRSGPAAASCVGWRATSTQTAERRAKTFDRKVDAQRFQAQIETVEDHR